VCGLLAQLADKRPSPGSAEQSDNFRLDIKQGARRNRAKLL
jgi:hypothetical protein